MMPIAGITSIQNLQMVALAKVAVGFQVTSKIFAASCATARISRASQVYSFWNVSRKEA